MKLLFSLDIFMYSGVPFRWFSGNSAEISRMPEKNDFGPSSADSGDFPFFNQKKNLNYNYCILDKFFFSKNENLYLFRKFVIFQKFWKTILNDFFVRKYKQIKNMENRPNSPESAEIVFFSGIRPISAEFPENHWNGTPLYNL
jgi:hypothetical protein